MSESGFSRAGFLPARVIHLHPSRFCNYACQHCYSASGPHRREELAPEVILAALAVLKAEGYEVLSLSGGEPLLYGGLEPLLQGAAALGLQINLISNGVPVAGHILDLIVEYVSLIAISLDGGPEKHCELRGNRHAFAHASRAMERLAAAGKRFGIAYCVSQESLADMPWAVEFARQQGADLVHFHPFAATGRGRALAHRLCLSSTDKARAYIVATLLHTDHAPFVQVDLAPVNSVYARRSQYAALTLDHATPASLSDLVNPLVIDERGQLLPFCFGINPELGIGHIDPHLSTTLATYRTEGRLRLHALLATAFDRVQACDEKFIDWYSALAETSYMSLHPHGAEPLATV